MITIAGIEQNLSLNIFRDTLVELQTIWKNCKRWTTSMEDEFDGRECKYRELELMKLRPMEGISWYIER